MTFRTKNIFGLIILAAGIYLATNSIFESWTHFIDQCPNKDVLGWDANLRFNTIVDLYQDLKQGDFFSPLNYTIKSPTWPTLRGHIALLMFFISDSGPNTILDVIISMIFYILVFIALFWISLDLSRDFFKASIIWLTVSQLILHTRQFSAYALSSMLETQGMFFMLLTAYFLYKIYEQQRNALFAGFHEHRSWLKRPVRYWPGLFLSAQGLFHTKYPYGLMLFISVGLYELIRQRQSFINFFGFGKKYFYIGKRKAYLIFIAIFIISLIATIILSRYDNFGIPGHLLKSKFIKNIIWIITLFVFLDLNYCIFKYRFELKELFDSAFRQIYLVLLFPIAIWLLMHPDRLGSIIGTQQHSQEASRSFILSFLGYVFDRPEPVLIISILSVIGVFIFYSSFFMHSQFKQSIRNILIHPISALVFIIVFQFLILEKLTGNKQLRHIYHLIPVMLFLLVLFAIRIPRYLHSSKYLFPVPLFLISRAGYVILPLSLLFFIQPFETNEEFKHELGYYIKNYKYTDKRHLCFTGYNQEIFEPVRDIVKKAMLEKNTLVFNVLHNPLIQNPARSLATEFDLLLRIEGIKKGSIVRNDNEWTDRKWNGFSHVIVINLGCNENDFDRVVSRRVEKMNHNIKIEDSFHHIKTNICMKQYALIKK